MTNPPIRLLANGMVGLGFSRKSFAAGLARAPHMVGCDAGTSDFGPGPLGSGSHPKSRRNVERDLRIMLLGARELGIPMVIGSCGGSGSDPHLAFYADIVRNIAKEAGLHFRLALVHAEQDRTQILDALTDGRIEPLGPIAQLTVEAVEASERIVAMMGAKPLTEALDAGADVVLAGRCTDPAIFASVGLRNGGAAGPVWHAAKSIDKGPLATTQPSAGSSILATVEQGSFVIESMDPASMCTTASVAGITLHENPDPWHVSQPSGVIGTRSARYEQLDDRSVRVTGSTFTPASVPSVKLEGARLVGHRAILIAGIRDPRLIARLDEFLDRLRDTLARVAASVGIADGDYQLRFRVYGRDAVMGPLEPDPGDVGKEVCLIVDVVAEDPDTAYALASRAGPTGSRLDITGHLGGGGNFAYPFSLPTIRVGPVYEWSAWHVMQVDDECDPFAIEMVQL